MVCFGVVLFSFVVGGTTNDAFACAWLAACWRDARCFCLYARAGTWACRCAFLRLVCARTHRRSYATAHVRRARPVLSTYLTIPRYIYIYSLPHHISMRHAPYAWHAHACRATLLAAFAYALQRARTQLFACAALLAHFALPRHLHAFTRCACACARFDHRRRILRAHARARARTSVS